MPLLSRPTFRTYTELPISVRHVWDGYPIVDLALEALERGQFHDASLLADAVFTDDRVAGCLSTRVNGLFGLPLEIRYPGQTRAKPGVRVVHGPGEGGGAGEDQQVLALKKEIAEKCRENWERMFPSAAAREQMRWGLLLNAGIGELVWDWGSDGLVWPTLKTWNPQFLYWRWDTRSYWLIHQDGQEEIRAGDGRWMVLSPYGHNHGWLYGLIRSLAKLWLDRQFAWRDWARASEKYSLGVTKGKVPMNASEPDKAQFSASMTNLPNESFVMLPQGETQQASFDVEMMTTDSAVNWQSFKERFGQLDTSIAILILGQNLSTEVQGGSRAAAEVHENVRQDVLKADDQIWSTTVRTQILAPWVAYNWGDLIAESGRTLNEFVPEVTHKVDPPEDLEKQAKVFLAVSQALMNLQGAPVDIRAVLEHYNIPVLSGDSPAVGDAPPGADVNERPPAPTPDSVLNVVQARRRRGGRPVGSKLGQVKGRVRADEIMDAAKKVAAKVLDPRRQALMEIIQTSEGLDEMRERIKDLYKDLKASQLREILEKAYMAAQLLGRLTAVVDHRG